MVNIYITMGIQASGKSTWARKMVSESLAFVRFCRDDARAMLNGGDPWKHFNTDKQDTVENTVTVMRDAFILKGLEEGKHIILDETNAGSRTFKEVCRLLDGHDFEATVLEFPFYVDVEVAIQRDASRTPSVGESIIRKFYKRFGEQKFASYVPKVKQFVPLKTLGPAKGGYPAIICDLDGTLALFGDKNPYDRDFENDDVNEAVAEILEKFADAGYKILFVSGRAEKNRAKTMEFLENNKFDMFDFDLFMRENGDYRNDKIVKAEIYENKIYKHWDISFVFDDRNRVVDMWRKMGLTCLQVAEGDF